MSSNKKTILTVSVLALAAAMLSLFIFNNNDSNTVEASIPSDQGKTILEASQGVSILKADITEKASFYPYQAGDTYMEVIAIKASDGTVRTALNTCQVCTGSGRAYYEQEGDVLVCQNCGNRFTVDQIEVIKGGCNPVPVLAQNKTDDGETIGISDEFLIANKDLFINWKTS